VFEIGCGSVHLGVLSSPPSDCKVDCRLDRGFGSNGDGCAYGVEAAVGYWVGLSQQWSGSGGSAGGGGAARPGWSGGLEYSFVNNSVPSCP
jgi:hypothetical protein